MLLIKKFFSLLGLVVFVCILTLLLLFMSVNAGYLDKPIKKLVVFYLSKTGQKILIGDLHVKNNSLSIDEILIDLDKNNRVKLQNVTANILIKDIINKPLILSNINVEDYSIIAIQTNQVLLNTKVNSILKIDLVHNQISSQISIGSINMVSVLDNFGKKLPIGEGACNYNSKMLTGSEISAGCRFSFDEATYLEFSGTLHGSHLQATGNAQNIPVIFGQFAGKILPNNEISLFLQEHIKGGYLSKAEVNLNFDIKQALEQNLLSKEALNAKLHIVDLEYKYDRNFPTLKKIDSDIIISGAHTEFVINKAYSSNSLISGLVTFDWKGINHSDFIINAIANGTTSDLIDFILIEDYNAIKKQGIDLKTINGKAQTTIKLKIPLSPDIKNSYNITSKVNGVSARAFNNNITLRNASITGTFNGDKIDLTGRGKVNNFDSKFTYSHNMNEHNKDDYKDWLKVQTNMTGDKQKIGIVKIVSGHANLNFEYKRKKDNANLISMRSNLKGLEFYLDKIAISKKLHKEASLNVTGKLQDSSNGNISFDLSGEDGLKITGNIGLKGKKYSVDIPVIRYNTAQLYGRLFLDTDNFSTEIKGSSLDLSQANMMQFLEKVGEGRNTNLKVNIDKIRLKNNIWLDQFNLQINCNKLKCFSGELNSKIGTKAFKMLLIDKNDAERWIVTCDNAGALLKGVGMYNNMRSGRINLTLDTKRHEVKKGEIIPILDGQFTINNFIMTDTSFFTRIASFVSFPGFMSVIINNKNITFKEMKGEFNYIGNTVKVLDTSATGPFFDFTMRGTIDTRKHKMKLKGNVIPSFFFLGSVITKIPVIGKIFSKVAPYSLDLDYKE
jgi:hypothetical protein